MKIKTWLVCGVVLGSLTIARAAEFNVGGLVYDDVDDPLASGLGGITVTIAGSAGTYTTTTWGQSQTVPGLWTIADVPAGTYTVMPTAPGQCFSHYILGEEQAPLPLIIVVGPDNRAVNESIEFVPAATGGCDDGLACTTSDVCVGGVCVGVPVPDCSEQDPPADNDPPVDNPGSPGGGGGGGGPAALPNTTPDAVVGACQQDSDGDRVMDCDDLCPSTGADQAVSSSGCSCDEMTCDDGNPCTTDGCSNGQCVHTAIICVDDDPCTLDRCVDGACVNDPRDCSDDDPCTDDVCTDGRCTNEPLCGSGELCEDGVCLPTQSAPECVVDADCDDGVYCNGAESCSGGTCTPGAAPCTADQVCNENLEACGEIVASGVTPEETRPLCGAFGGGGAALMVVLMLGCAMMHCRPRRSGPPLDHPQP